MGKKIAIFVIISQFLQQFYIFFFPEKGAAVARSERPRKEAKIETEKISTKPRLKPIIFLLFAA